MLIFCIPIFSRIDRTSTEMNLKSVDLKKDLSKKFVCPESDKSYSDLRSLRRHVMKCHPGYTKLDILMPRKIYDFPCSECGRNFSKKKHLNYHVRMNHSMENSFFKKIVYVSCPLCKNDVEKDNFNSHCHLVHNISVQTEEIYFSTYEEFCYWKENTEKETNARFVKSSGDCKRVGKTKIYLKCHRSGHFSSKSKGQRHLKSQGSCKINGYCPAGIKISKSSDNNGCHIIFTKTHVGHDNILSQLSLSSKEKEMLAEKIASKIPFDVILDEVRDTVTANNLERIHLITRKDLHNIKQCYNITEACYQDDGISHGYCGVDEGSSTSFIVESAEDEIIFDEICESNITNKEREKPMSLIEEKEMLKEYFNDIIDSVKSMQELEAMKKLFASLKTTVEAIRHA